MRFCVVARSRITTTTTNIGNVIHQSHRCVRLFQRRHVVRQSWPVVGEGFTIQLPVAARTIHTLTNDRFSAFYSSLSYTALQPVPYRSRWKTRLSYFSTDNTHTPITSVDKDGASIVITSATTEAPSISPSRPSTVSSFLEQLSQTNETTIANVDKHVAASTSTETKSISPSRSNQDISSFDSPSNLSSMLDDLVHSYETTIANVDKDASSPTHAASTSAETKSISPSMLNKNLPTLDSPSNLSSILDDLVHSYETTIANVDKDAATRTSTETISISPSLSSTGVSSFEFASTFPSPLDQCEKDQGKFVEAQETRSDYTDFEFREMTEDFIHMNVTQVSPSVQDLALMKLCIRFWQKRYTSESWQNLSQLFQQLILSLKHQEHSVFTEWYMNKRVPEMTRLLNGVVDEWRITRKSRDRRHPQSNVFISNQKSIIQWPSPSQMLDQLLTWKSMEPMLLFNARSYNLIMQAALEDYRTDETPIFCESIFRSMLPTKSSAFDKRALPDTNTYTLVLQAWNKCTGNPEATERVWDLFNEIHQLRRDGILEIPLDALHYTIVIDALMRTQQVDWMNRAEHIFQRMQKSWMATPFAGTYAVYLSGWLSYKDLTLEQWHRCKTVLNDALERSKASPEQPLVNASLFARFMVKASNLGRDDLAEQIFTELCQWYKEFPVSSMTPDVHCLKAMLHMYTRTLRPDPAEQVLFTLIKEGHRRNRPEWWPKAHHFEVVIQCWIRHTVCKEGGLERAGQLLLRAVELEREICLNLSDEPLCGIISAWAQSGRHDAPSHAAALLKAFQSRSKKPVRSACLHLVENMQSPSFQQQQQQTTGSTN
jgi:hypothetical protein